MPSGMAAVQPRRHLAHRMRPPPARTPGSRTGWSSPLTGAAAMETKGWGLKPSVCLIWMPARKKARWKVRIRSRWEMYLARPSLGEEQAVSHCTPLLFSSRLAPQPEHGCGSPGWSGTGSTAPAHATGKRGSPWRSMRHQGNTSSCAAAPGGRRSPRPARRPPGHPSTAGSRNTRSRSRTWPHAARPTPTRRPGGGPPGRRSPPDKLVSGSCQL